MPTSTIQSERGIALLAALLIAVVLSALGTALTVSGQTESSIVSNHQRAAEARASAEAGLSHAVQLAVRNLNAFQANGFATPQAAITRLLRGPDNAIDANPNNPANADNGSFEALELAGELELPRFPPLVAAPGGAGATYQGRIIDEDHPSRNLQPADVTRINENNQAEADTNRRAVVRITGFAGENTTVTIEGIIARQIGSAIATDQTITVSGNPQLIGADGGIHSNVNVVNTGNPNIAANYTATGTYTNTGNPVIGGEFGGGRAVIPIPAVAAANYRQAVNDAAAVNGPLPVPITNNNGLVLTVGGLTGGRIYEGFLDPIAGTLPVVPVCMNVAACHAAYGLVYNPGGGGWVVPGITLQNNTVYYVRGNLTISGNPPNNGTYRRVTFIAEGNIEVGGDPWLTPHMIGPMGPVMFVTDRDMRLNGNMRMQPGIEGQILVREQLQISGNPILFGQFLVDNAASASNFVLNTVISGNPQITYNGLVNGTGFTVTGWREVR